VKEYHYCSKIEEEFGQNFVQNLRTSLGLTKLTSIDAPLEGKHFYCWNYPHNCS
jgi:hypothetical protein